MDENLTIEQRRSGDAYFKVNKVLDEKPGIQEKYKSRAKNLPSMVRTNGLLQSLSFLLSKKKDDRGCELISAHVQEWIKTAVNNQWLPKPPEGNTLDDMPSTIQWLTQVDVEQYMIVTNEVLSFSPWLKRFASGML